MTKKNYITLPGFQKIKEELHQLLSVDRPQLVQVISWAASNGDRSENGDYIYGKRKLREIDRKIRFLSQRLELAEIIDCKKQDSTRVLFGAQVLVLDEQERKRSYQIVGEDEIDVKNGKVSWVSPIAKALLNSRVGDIVSFKSPSGTMDLEILQITYD